MIYEEIKTRLLLPGRERRRWQGKKPSTDSIRVFYGVDELPRRDEAAAGGIIKFQDLQGVYPNTPQGANILYMVTSALPPYAVVIAKVARAHGCRVVINQNGVAYPGCYATGWRSLNRPMRKLLGLADHVFYQSEFCRKAADTFLGRYNGSAETLYNPVDTEIFRPAAQRDASSPLRLLLAGSHCDYYRVATAIETVACLRKDGTDSRLIIAGRYRWREPESQAIAEGRHLAAQLGVDDVISFEGAYAQEEAPALFQKADILLHTKYNDPCPRLVVEALASGLPVVFSESGGVPELVGPEAGAGVPAPCDWSASHPPAPSVLAECAKKIMVDYERYAAAARKRAVEKFDVRPWVKRHCEVFETLVMQQ